LSMDDSHHRRIDSVAAELGISPLADNARNVSRRTMTRPRLQLYLSTLLIVTVLAGVLVWLNVRSNDTGVLYSRGWERQIRSPAFARGWPWTYQEHVRHEIETSLYPTFELKAVGLDTAVCLLL